MADRKIVEEWLEKAESDYRFACINLEDTADEFFAQICFHFQQSAEKYLKAYIVANDLPFKKIHDLVELMQTCTSKEKDFSSLKEECEFLTDYYIDTRYPVHWPATYSREETEMAKQSAEKIRNFIKDKLSKVITNN